MPLFSLPVIIAFTSFCLAVAACIAVYLLFYRTGSRTKDRPHFGLDRHEHNPIISPLPHREWQVSGTLNPAAIEDDEGKIHLLFRAIGADGVSRIGHAASNDGVHFDERSMYPVYEPIPGYGLPDKEIMTPTVPKYDPAIYTSGGGWAGSEDPRAVRIGDRIYMTYVAFAGWHSVRIALTSISVKDFKLQHWNWKRPMLISPYGQVHKNWVLFPEKIRGKYAILHGVSPEVQVDFFETLDTLRLKPIHSKIPHDARGHYSGRSNYWDNQVRGTGAPPVKTRLGWLLLYHSMDRNDPNKYKLGAMILDHDNPKKILYRSPQPILSPEMHYENDGKPGVIYASGALIKDDQLLVYYGGGDRHTCVAQTPVPELLDWLVKFGKV